MCRRLLNPQYLAFPPPFAMDSRRPRVRRPAIVDRLARELRAAVMSEDVRERMLSEGAQPMASTPAEYAAEIDSEERKWSALVKSLNLKME